jgi:hypothetical protein
MRPELEALVAALDALIEARGGNEAKRLEQAYESLLDRTLEVHPNVSRGTLTKLVDFAHRHWRKAQQRPSTMPPKA